MNEQSSQILTVGLRVDFAAGASIAHLQCLHPDQHSSANGAAQPVEQGLCQQAHQHCFLPALHRIQVSLWSLVSIKACNDLGLPQIASSLLFMKSRSGRRNAELKKSISASLCRCRASRQKSPMASVLKSVCVLSPVSSYLQTKCLNRHHWSCDSSIQYNMMCVASCTDPSRLRRYATGGAMKQARCNKRPNEAAPRP